MNRFLILLVVLSSFIVGCSRNNSTVVVANFVGAGICQMYALSTDGTDT